MSASCIQDTCCLSQHIRCCRTKLSSTDGSEIRGVRKEDSPGSVYVAMPLYIPMGSLRFEVRDDIAQVNSHRELED